VKYRESFRPFAPSVRQEDVTERFELDGESPYMLRVADLAKHRRRGHDGGGAGPLRHREAQRPALADPRGDARRLLGTGPDRPSRDPSAVSFRCFLGAGIEVLAIGNCYLRKENPGLKRDDKSAFDLD
jgi:carbamoyltransferase